MRSFSIEEFSLYQKKQTFSPHGKNWCWSWSSNTLATWWEELTHVKRPWSWARLRAGGEGDDIGWDGWMASPTRWTGVWENPGKEWRTEEPGTLQSLGSQRVGHEWATEQQWQWCQCYMGAKPGLLGGGDLWWNRISQASEGAPGRGGRLWKRFLLVALSLRD